MDKVHGMKHQAEGCPLQAHQPRPARSIAARATSKRPAATPQAPPAPVPAPLPTSVTKRHRGDDGEMLERSIDDLKGPDGTFRQQLHPLSEADEAARSKAVLDPESEEENVPVVKFVSYRRPQGHRRRPGNSVALAVRNFVAETKV